MPEHNHICTNIRSEAYENLRLVIVVEKKANDGFMGKHVEGVENRALSC